MESMVELLPNGGIMGARVQQHDWASTSLGPIATWPQSLKSLVNLVLAAPLPMNLLWGPELIQIYNDAYAPPMGLKHPAGLGQPAAECWHEVWEVAGPLYVRVFAGETVVLENSQWILNRHGVPEAAWFDNYLIPVLDENGAVGGALAIAFETTGRVKAAEERDQSEQALRASEQRFRQFAENSSNVLWILDLAAMRLEYLSPAFEAIWGETIESTLGDHGHWDRFLHPDDRQRVFDALDLVRLGEAITEEFRIVRSGGAVRWLRNTFFPILDAQGQIRCAGGIAQDISRHDGHFVYVVDADEASRQDLTRGLRDAGYDVRAFPSGKAFLEAAPALAAGCVVLDMRQPGAGGLTIPRELKARRIGLPVIVLGEIQSDVKSAVQVMKAGAVDFLPIPYNPDELLTALASAAADISQADEQDQEANRVRGRIAEMPVREREVLEGLLAGQTNKQMGRDIGISPRTVETHRAHVMQRLAARTIPELVRIAALAGGRARG